MTGIDHSHDPHASSWVPGADEHSGFPVQNLPLGVFSRDGGPPGIGAAVGDHVVDLRALAACGLLPAQVRDALSADVLNALFALPHAGRLALRHALFALLTTPERAAEVRGHLHPIQECRMHLPFRIGDFTDFYAGIHHATNIGKLFRPDNPLLPNYKHVPIGYHGRASSVRASGAPVVRPNGQIRAQGAESPEFGPCRRLDYELELGVWIAGENALGEPVPIASAAARIGGFCLLNDWSARDIQAWEYQPLGPFLAKNFMTSVSPWVVTAEALAPFRIAQPPRPEGDPAPLPYLFDERDQAEGALAVTLDVLIATRRMREAGRPPVRLSTGTAAGMYWTVAQMVAHHGSNGCNLMPGDLLGTGAISGPERSAFGSLLEISDGGKMPVELPGGETRTFLEDGDEIILAGRAERPGRRTIGFGACSGIVAGHRPAGV